MKKRLNQHSDYERSNSPLGFRSVPPDFTSIYYYSDTVIIVTDKEHARAVIDALAEPRPGVRQ